MFVKLLSDRVGFHYCNGLIRGILCLAFVLGIFAGAHPLHAAPPAPDPRFGAVEAHMLPDAAASLRPGWDRLRFDWGALQLGRQMACRVRAYHAICIAPSMTPQMCGQTLCAAP